MKFQPSTFLLPFAFVLGGCVPVIVHCHYVYLKPQPALTVKAESYSYGECHCRLGKAPTEYEISRPAYTVGFAIGERWWTELMLDARDTSNRALKIESPYISEIKGIPYFHYRKNPRLYTYSVRFDALRESVLEFRVVDDAGHVLGSEKIPFEIREGRALETDGP